jgi:hypothetical protein
MFIASMQMNIYDGHAHNNRLPNQRKWLVLSVHIYKRKSEVGPSSRLVN